MLQIMERITHGQGREGDIEELEELCGLIKSTALCALGGTAPNPVLSTIRYFRDEYEAHIKEHRCPALACTDLISYYIVPDKCQGCGICLRACPVEAIKGDRRMIHIIDQERCTKCGTCLNVCPERFGSVTRVSGVEIEPIEELVPVTAAPPGKASVAE
jgi:NADH-quinone oxidoreductase subunit F